MHDYDYDMTMLTIVVFGGLGYRLWSCGIVRSMNGAATLEVMRLLIPTDNRTAARVSV